MRKNVILIGMPGAGKSTVGVVLAKRLGYQFVDSDLVIQSREGKLLQELIEEHGVEGFLRLENRINAGLDLKNAVIATGGSAVYGREAMEHFRETGAVAYLSLPYESVKERLGDLSERGVVMQNARTLYDLYRERTPLYEKWADITVDCEERSIREIVEELAGRLCRQGEYR